MKKIILPLLICLLLCACSKELEPSEMPQVDAAPTAAPAAVPSYSAGTGPEKYVWNEAVSFDISSPGVTGERIQQELSHSKSLLLFGQNSFQIRDQIDLSFHSGNVFQVVIQTVIRI